MWMEKIGAVVKNMASNAQWPVGNAEVPHAQTQMLLLKLNVTVTLMKTSSRCFKLQRPTELPYAYVSFGFSCPKLLIYALQSFSCKNPLVII